LRLGALPTLQKVIGSDLVVNPTLLGLAAKPDPKHFKTGLGLAV